MNRIAFRLFKKWGANLQFKRFITDLTTLQEGKYEERLELWFNLMNEYEETLKSDANDMNLEYFVSREKFSNVVRASYPQNESRQSFEEITARVFKGGSSVMEMKELLEVCQSDKEVERMCRTIL